MLTIVDLLRQELLSLTQQCQNHNIKLIVGGGYGLLLRTEEINKNRPKTLFEYVPIARSTNDLDIFLSSEIIVSVEKTKIFRAILNDLSYEPKSGAEYYQFWKETDINGQVRKLKIDLLCPAIIGERKNLVEQDERRVRPKSSQKIAKLEKLHGRKTEEAASLEEGLYPIYLNDSLYVYIPHPFTYIMLKLFAIRDHLTQSDKGRADYHSFDLYRVVAMLTEQEWQECIDLCGRYRELSSQAFEIVSEHFQDLESLGTLALRKYIKDNAEPIDEKQVQDLIDSLKDILKFIS